MRGPIACHSRELARRWRPPAGTLGAFGPPVRPEIILIRRFNSLLRPKKFLVLTGGQPALNATGVDSRGRNRCVPRCRLFVKVRDGSSRRGDVAVVASIDLLLLMGFHEAFRCGVVAGVVDPAHAWLDALPVWRRSTRRRIARRRGEPDCRAPACRQRHGAGGQGQADIELRLQSLVKDATAESIDDHGEIAKPLANRISVIMSAPRPVNTPPTEVASRQP